MFLTKDNLILGIVLGFVSPLLGMVSFYLMKFSSLSVSEFFQILVLWKSFFTSLITVSLLANGLIFTIYTNTSRDETAMGIFISTCIYAVVCITLKYVM